MTISLTCHCGARLEIDETFAGQTINCPDCQRPLKTPRPERAGVQTSGFALTSLILALAGAFTLLGTLLAIVFGALGLRDIARRPEEVTGKGFAVAGIVLGVLLSAVTAFALVTPEFFGMPANNLLARAQWAGRLEDPDELEIKEERYTIKRPSHQWKVKSHKVGVGGWEQQQAQRASGELLLVNLDEDAHLWCYLESGEKDDLRETLNKVLDDFRLRDRAGIFSWGKPTNKAGNWKVEEGAVSRNPVGKEMWEAVVDKGLAGQRRRFLVRVVRRTGDATVYVLIGGTTVSRFAKLRDTLKAMMDSLE